jgi:ABC-type lipoprotein release transport system permease subunit
MTQDVSIDPVMVVAATTLLVAVVMLAAWSPARRAARIHPVVALKGD